MRSLLSLLLDILTLVFDVVTLLTNGEYYEYRNR